MEENIKSILIELKKNCFDTLKDGETKIPNELGNYLLCLRKKSRLPKISIEPIFIRRFEEFDVIYTGISCNLRKRDYRQHFIGNNAGRSTIRKSLGVLFGYNKIPRDKNGKSNKKKFEANDEIKLSKWMAKNLILFFSPTSKFIELETELINHFNPPLNLKGNHNPINKEYRNELKRLRRK